MNILGKREVVNLKVLGALYKKLGAIPVNRENVEPSTIREVIAVLKKGNKLILFPEGTRKKPKGLRLGKIKNGAALFALSTGVPIIPMIIDKKPRIFRRNLLLIGKPFYLEEKRLNKENIAGATETIKRKMREVIEDLEKYKAGNKS
jgi:1-acyl-sn-glycerol-3-phosphate acyltransferase